MRMNIFKFVLICFLLSMISCNNKKSEETTLYLFKLDSLLESQPTLVLDSINALEEVKLSRFNTAYSNLLKTIALDKTDFIFKNDSVIKKSAEVLSHYNKDFAELYARSLLYEGIVRFRMGINDSTAYVPIKTATNILENSKLENSRSAMFAYYYLGTLFFANNNPEQSIAYFKKAIQVAKHFGHRNYLYNSFRDLAWSYMQNYDWDNTKLCIDTLSGFQNLSELEVIDISLIKSSYYESVNEPQKALFINLKLINDTLYLKNSDISKTYYKVSKNYKNLDQKQQSLFYAEKAVENITDTANLLNYFYYENAAEIAASLKHWEKSSQVLIEAYRLKSKLMEINNKAALLELEKKYDLNKAENEVLRQKNQKFLFVGITIILFMIVIEGFVLRRQFIKRKKAELNLAKSEKQKFEIEHQQTMLDKERIELDLKQKNFLLPIYSQISERNEMVKKVLQDLKTNKYIEKNSSLLQKIETTYKDFTQSSIIDPAMFFSDKDFFEFTGIYMTDKRAKELNSSDKILLIFSRFDLANNQIAILLNTTEDSVRSRKSKLRKKLRDNNIILKRINI